MATDPSNASRADWARIGLQAYRDRTVFGPRDRNLSDHESFAEALSDLLCDLMHLADQMGEGDEPSGTPYGPGVLFGSCLTRATADYGEEVAEELDD